MRYCGMCMWECVYVLGVGIESQCETIHSTFFIYFLSLKRYLFAYKWITVCLCESVRVCWFIFACVFVLLTLCLLWRTERENRLKQAIGRRKRPCGRGWIIDIVLARPYPCVSSKSLGLEFDPLIYMHTENRLYPGPVKRTYTHICTHSVLGGEFHWDRSVLMWSLWLWGLETGESGSMQKSWFFLDRIA